MATNLYSKILKLAVEGNNEEALVLCDELLQLRGDSFDFNLQGVCFYNLKRYDEAIQAYDKSIELNQENAYAICNKGHVLYDIGNSGEAFKYYASAIDINPKFAHGHGGMGKVLSLQGKAKESIEHFDKAVEFDSQNPLFLCNRAKAYKQLGESELAFNDFKAASTLIEKGRFGDLTSGIIDYIKETLKDLLILETITKKAEKAIEKLDATNPEFSEVIEQFEKLKQAKEVVTDNVVKTLNDKKAPLTTQETMTKEKILHILEQDSSQILTVLDEYPEAVNYSEVIPFLIKQLQISSRED